MWDFNAGQALGLMRRTAPFVVFRMVVYFGIAVAFVLMTGTGAGIGWASAASATTAFAPRARCGAACSASA